ncbi:MAG: glycosyltransferase family 39 protein [Bryobacteraceae bacterium]
MQTPPPHARTGLWLLCILAFALALRLYHVTEPAWDYHNWRQTITLMVARDFAREGFPLWHPQVAWLGRGPSDPSYFSAEFSIQSVLAALLYRTFGESETLARLVVIAFSLLGIACLYDMLERRTGPLAARTGAFLYALLPYHVFFGRVFMPDVPAISLALAGLDALDRWTGKRKLSWLCAAGVLTALAILQKLTVLFALVPAAYLLFLVEGRRILRRPEPYVFAALAAIPPLIWYAHVVAMAPISVFAMDRGLFGHRLDLWVHGTFIVSVLKALSQEAFSPAGVALVLLGLLYPTRGRAIWTFRCWFLAAALLLFLMPGVLPSNHYYLSLLLPGGAGMAGIALAGLLHRRPGLLAAVLAIFAVAAIGSAVPLYEPDRLPHDLGVRLRSMTAPDDLIVTETGGSPNVLYYADRRGWLLFREFDPARVENLRRSGAAWYADAFPRDPQEHPDFFRALNERYRRVAEDSPWRIYRLSASPTN